MKGQFWQVSNGTTRLRLRADTHADAVRRASELGLHTPTRVVLEEPVDEATRRAIEAWPTLGGRPINPEFLTGED